MILFCMVLPLKNPFASSNPKKIGEKKSFLYLMVLLGCSLDLNESYNNKSGNSDIKSNKSYSYSWKIYLSNRYFRYEINNICITFVLSNNKKTTHSTL